MARNPYIRDVNSEQKLVEDLTIETLKLAKTIESKLSSAVKIGKEAFYKQVTMPLDQAYEYTGEVMVKNMLD